MMTTNETTTAAVAVERVDAVERVHVANRLWKVKISDVSSAEIGDKIRVIQELADAADMTDEEIGLKLGLSKAWVGMLRRNMTFLFYCGACGAQVQKKHAACRVCGNNGDDALRADVVVAA